MTDAALHDLAYSLDLSELAALRAQFEPIVGAAAQEARRAALSAAYRDQGIALVLGAGVSMGVGAPSWSDLMGRLVLAVVGTKLEPGMPISPAYEPFSRMFGQSLPGDALVVAHYAKLALGARMSPTDENFIRVLRSALYPPSIQPIESNELLVTLAAACRTQESGAMGVHEVITYNFDELFEEALTISGVDFETVPRHARARAGLPVFHPHGVVHRDPNRADNWVVLAEDEYHRELAAPHSWSNIVQLNAFSQMRCCFVGSSMTDPNLRRLLAAARGGSAAEHFAFLRRRDVDAAMQRTAAAHGGLPAELEHALRARVEVACMGGDVADDMTLASLGTHVIWFDEFDQLADLFRDLTFG